MSEYTEADDNTTTDGTDAPEGSDAADGTVEAPDDDTPAKPAEKKKDQGPKVRALIIGSLSSHNILFDDQLRVYIVPRVQRHLVGEWASVGGEDAKRWSSPEVAILTADFNAATADEAAFHTQAVREKTLTPAADIFSFGSIVWEVFTLQVPYAQYEQPADALTHLRSGELPDLNELNTGLPKQGLSPSLAAPVAEIVAQCHQVAPQSRPSTQKVADLLRGLVKTPKN